MVFLLKGRFGLVSISLRSQDIEQVPCQLISRREEKPQAIDLKRKYQSAIDIFKAFSTLGSSVESNSFLRAVRPSPTLPAFSRPSAVARLAPTRMRSCRAHKKNRPAIAGRLSMAA
jgi:hypothetical protein